MMRCLLAFLGLILIAVGVLVAVAAAVAYSEGGTPGAICLAIMSLLLILTGLGWAGHRRRARSWRNDPATDKQKEFADELGIRYWKGITKGELSDLISQKTGK